MSSRSFERLNYGLRPNKNVERKLIVESLQRLSSKFNISKYRYIGFGSMWFADFVLMHKILHISDLVSIEGEKSRSKRVEFNKPFRCIDVLMNKAALVLESAITASQCILWLDYDGPLKDALSGDLEIALPMLSSGSVILVTVNANAAQLSNLKGSNGDNEPIDSLVEIVGDETLRNQKNRIAKNLFPELCTEILHDRINTIVLERTSLEYRPIWTFRYADDAEMVTVGGIVADQSDATKVDETEILSLPYCSAKAVYRIDLPVLTDKEKRALDKLLPSLVPLSRQSLDFELRDVEIQAYEKFYRFYPVFGEIAV